jgi:osmotically-inducible protein OsmY
MHNFKLNPRTALMVSSALVMVGGLPLQAAYQDDRVEASAKNSYNFKTYLKGDNIKIECSHGVATLSGTVSQDHHRLLAEHTVAGLPGVTSVDNQLVVSGDQPKEHSDGWISMKVKGTLAFRKNVSATGTEVHTENGVVTLKGNADNEAEKLLVTEYVKDVEGVKDVNNQMTVTGQKHQRTVGEKIDDASITAQLKTTLVFHRSTHPVDTKVHTKNGVVTLTGEAQNAAEKDLVTKLAEDISGVKHVKNHMTVK